MQSPPPRDPVISPGIDPMGLARQLLQGGQYESCIEVLVEAAKSGAASADAYALMGDAHQYCGRLRAALDSYRRALWLNPRHVFAHNNMGGALQHLGRLDAASACYRNALALKPDFPEAWNNLGGTLQLQGCLDESIACYRSALALRPYYPDANSSLLMALASHPRIDRREYLQHARSYGGKMQALAQPFANWHAMPLQGAAKLRVGFVSGELRMNPVGYFLESTLAHLDRSRIELLAFATDRREDALTARIRPYFSDWDSLAGLSDETSAHRIHAAAPHILVDLAGHTSSNRLAVFAWKPAPVQVSWLGYFASTGVPGMDYVLADPVSVPECRGEEFSESVWHMPETRLCFTAPADAGMATAPLPALRNGYVTFGSFQRLTKLNDAVLAVWASVLQALPTARLRLQAIEMRRPEARASLLRRLEAAGIAPQRVTVLADTDRAAYLAAHAEVDMILDTFPFPGGTTTCEALWMGVPTMTLAGDSMLARQGASLLCAAGLRDWVAGSATEYVARAVAHASSPRSLAVLRSHLRTRVCKSPLLDAARFAGYLETALLGMWERHLASQSATHARCGPRHLAWRNNPA